MDTRRELLRDDWIERHKGMCGTCGFRQFESIDKGYVCCCPDSDHAADWVEDTDGCDEWYEGRARQ